MGYQELMSMIFLVINGDLGRDNPSVRSVWAYFDFDMP